MQNILRSKENKYERNNIDQRSLVKIRKAAKKNVVKAIIETCYLDKNEIVKLSKICMQTKIDFVKTSTGFGTGGARLEDVKLIYDTVKGVCMVKASGGIRSREDAVNFINAGASRIGTSHII